MPDLNKGIINYGSIGGDAHVTSKDVHVGDYITVEATSSNVAIKSSLNRATQSLRASPTTDAQTQEQLAKRLADLQEALAKIPAEHAQAAEAVARQAETALAAATEKKPNHTLLQVTTEGLKAAAATLAVVAPPVVAIAKDIAFIISKIASV